MAFGLIATNLVHLLAWPDVLYLVLGTFIGILFGILPGLGGPQVVALLLPLTYVLNQNEAMTMLIGAMAAVPASGSITAILLNTPGSGQNLATLLDGYPLSKMGQAAKALGASVTASGLGAVVGVIALALLLPVGEKVVLAFSYPEFFMMALLAFTTIAVISRQSTMLGLIAAGLGLLLTTVGMDPVTGINRFTFGVEYLWDGIRLIPVTIGLFAVCEGIDLFVEMGKTIAQSDEAIGFRGLVDGMKSVFQNFGVFLRSSVIGTVVGIIPGVGASVASFMAYSQAVNTAKDKSQFGKGDIRGLIAPEAALNAKDGGQLIPTLLFGLPGSVEMAVFLGALTIQGIQPGPNMIFNHPNLPYVLALALVLANVITSIVVLSTGRWLAKITMVPNAILAPTIIVLALLGAYATNGEFNDMILAGVFGVLGYLMKSVNIPRVPFLIALVLGGIMERNFIQTLQVGSWMSFLTRPISLGLLLASLLIVLVPALLERRKRRSGDRGPEGVPAEPPPRGQVGRMFSSTQFWLLMLVAATCALTGVVSLSLPQSSRWFPFGIAAATLALVLWHVFSAQRRHGLGRWFFDPQSVHWPKVLQVTGWIAAYLLALTFVNVWLVTPLFLLAFLAVGSRRKLLTSVSLAVVLGAFMFVLFKVVLGATF